MIARAINAAISFIMVDINQNQVGHSISNNNNNNNNWENESASSIKKREMLLIRTRLVL